MVIDNVVDWFAVIISLSALAWTVRESLVTRRELKAQEALAQSRLEQQEYRSLLDSFLLPLSTSLARSRKGFDHLRFGHESDVHHLEYYPGNLRMLFERLSDDRRLFWRVEIDQLQEHNEATVRLIDAYASRSRLSPEFQQGCEEFRRHATTWKAMWDAISDLTIPLSDLPGDQIAEPFPAGFDAIVRDEVDRIRSRAGVEDRPVSARG